MNAFDALYEGACGMTRSAAIEEIPTRQPEPRGKATAKQAA